MAPKLLTQTLLTIVCVAIVIISSCQKDGTAVQPLKPKASVDSIALNLLAGIWILNKIEYPKTATDWELANDAFNYLTMTLNGNHTVVFSDNSTITNTGTWSLSKDDSLITLSYGGDMETDTVRFVNPSTLQLTVPKQMSHNIQLYAYYRETYLLRK